MASPRDCQLCKFPPYSFGVHRNTRRSSATGLTAVDSIFKQFKKIDRYLQVERSKAKYIAFTEENKGQLLGLKIARSYYSAKRSCNLYSAPTD